ncbi:MAG: DUF2339 domain-containing protein [Gammaproteobacteria bacterium]|nr:DUF2339 domain-containing protein [Gammaproteobacteria bacterium]
MLGLIGLLFQLFILIVPFLIFIIFKKINRMERRINQINDRLSSLESRAPSTRQETVETEKARKKSPVEAPLTRAKVTAARADTAVVAKPEGSRVTEQARPVPSAKTAATTPSEPVAKRQLKTGKATASFSELDKKIKDWLFGGNTVARVGVVILFFGVAFFLKYAVDRGWLPVEIRIMAAAVGGMILIALGWRLRLKRQNYALILQGGGIGIVYLSVFAAVSLYELLPPLPGLALMVVLVGLSSMLAVQQNARSLAVLACIGGFLAPVLISRDGNHITLFSYYAVLNVGILMTAWFKAWRELNLIGFIFTFVIASLWGYQYYQPAYFSSVQPFLVLFFVFYVAIPILFSQRQPPRLKGYVDGSLIFGVPLVGFGLQSTLVRDFEYGLALSAVIIGLFYAVLATVLWQRKLENTRMLTEVFFALAVAFGTVAIPLAVDGRWTGAAWALEGAALLWVGIRQQRWLAQMFGLLVQVCAGAALLTEFTSPHAGTPILNGAYLSALMISGAGFLSAYLLCDAHRQRRSVSEISRGMLIWSLLWWFGAGVQEISIHAEDSYIKAAILVFATLSLAAIAYLRRRLAWSDLAYAMPLLLPVMIVITLLSYIDPAIWHPFASGGLIAWLLTFSFQYWILRTYESEWKTEMNSYWHLGTFWLLIFIVTWETAWLVEQLLPETDTWSHATWALVPAMVTAALPRSRQLLVWPVQHYEANYLGAGLLPLVGLSGLWALNASFQPGDPSPLVYIPVINPHELTQLFILAVSFFWLRHAYIELDNKLSRYSWFTLAFFVMNGMIARSVHFYTDIPFTFDALWDSPRYQASVSIVWTLAALLIMVIATRTKQRLSWLIGSVLLGAVVVKLFLVDLADIGTIARIISFIVVGLLILVIGYLSPMPPKAKEE